MNNPNTGPWTFRAKRLIDVAGASLLLLLSASALVSAAMVVLATIGSVLYQPIRTGQEGARYSAEQARRHEVKPGITNLAQVSGRNALSWEERFVLDVLYCGSPEHGAGRDLTILFRALISVVRRRGVSAPGHATMPQFLGGTRQSVAR